MSFRLFLHKGNGTEWKNLDYAFQDCNFFLKTEINRSLFQKLFLAEFCIYLVKPMTF